MGFANDGSGAAPAPGASALLAGLQSGVLGALAMLAWLGVSARWQRRGFWTAANLMASCFYGDTAIRSGFSSSTVSGLALYLVLYGLLGAAFGLLVARRARGLRLALLALLFALAWYYLAFGLLSRKLAPLVALLHSERPTVLGHLIYGGMLAGSGRRRAPGAGADAPESPEVPPPAAPVPET
jgi:hypothetical protein